MNNSENTPTAVHTLALARQVLEIEAQAILNRSSGSISASLGDE